MGEVGPVACVGFLVGGTVFWWAELDLVPLLGRATSSVVFWGVCGLNMTLDSLSLVFSFFLIVWRSVAHNFFIKAFNILY